MGNVFPRESRVETGTTPFYGCRFTVRFPSIDIAAFVGRNDFVFPSPSTSDTQTPLSILSAVDKGNPRYVRTVIMQGVYQIVPDGTRCQWHRRHPTSAKKGTSKVDIKILSTSPAENGLLTIRRHQTIFGRNHIPNATTSNRPSPFTSPTLKGCSMPLRYIRDTSRSGEALLSKFPTQEPSCLMA